MVLGTDSDIVLHAQRQIRSYLRNKVTEITLDLSEGMHRICQLAFPKASRVIERFHVQRLALDAVQEIRIKHRFGTQSMPIPMPGRTQNLRAENMSLSVLKTAKRSRNFRPAVATLCLNLLISEPPHSVREQTCFSDSSPDLKETYWLSQNLPYSISVLSKALQGLILPDGITVSPGLVSSHSIPLSQPSTGTPMES